MYEEGLRNTERYAGCNLPSEESDINVIDDFGIRESCMRVKDITMRDDDSVYSI